MEKRKNEMKKKQTKKRPTKDNYFLDLADLVSSRATCPRLKVGTLLVRDGMVISTGYNGAPRGLDHCTDVGCKVVNGHCARVVHSEVNSLLHAAYSGAFTKSATLYTRYLPCESCAKAIINAGISKVVYKEIYKNIDQLYTRELFGKAKINLQKKRSSG